MPPTVAIETLHRHLSFWNSLILGFAVVSPVAGLAAIRGVQTTVREHDEFCLGGSIPLYCLPPYLWFSSHVLRFPA